MPNGIERAFETLFQTPELYPFRLDFVQRAILFVRVAPEAMRKAAFLDERLLTPQTEGSWFDLERVFAAVERQASIKRPPTPLHFLFHVSHCGSTLLSRMIDEATSAFGLREPTPLRDLAGVHDHLGRPEAVLSSEAFNRILSAFLALWRRAPKTADGRASSAVTIKPTSNAQRLARPLLRLAPKARAVTLHLSAESHIATLLGGPNNIFDMRAWGPERMTRLTNIAGPPPSPFHALSPGELAALTWAAERVWQKRLLSDPALKARLLDIDFECFLAEPAETLDASCRHFGLDPDPDYLRRLPDAPVLNTYAKAQEHAYSASLRTQVLNTARREQAQEIAKGLAWLKRYAQTASPEASVVLAEAG
ncbi:MAG: hypothetical protein ACE5FO_13530 [Parvularculaceae bacterium]